MVIDLLYLLLLVIGIYRGTQRGFIVAILSVAGYLIALAAALKLSAVTAQYLGQITSPSSKWLPFFSFLIVFLAVVWLTRLLAKLIETALKWIWLGWLNSLLGALLFLSGYTLIYSVVLFYLVHLHLLGPAALSHSYTYPFIQLWGPAFLDSLGAWIPAYRSLFHYLEDFFEGVAQQLTLSLLHSN
ncbi:MAG: CvpA family protein [Chitinophagaceae bacterium]